MDREGEDDIKLDYSVKFVLFTLSELKVKVGGLRVKFVKVCE